MRQEMIRIAIFAGFFPPHTGGYEAYLYELTRRLPSHGIQPTIVTTTLNGALAASEKNDIITLPAIGVVQGTYPIVLPSPALYHLVGELQKRQVQLINTHTRFFTTSSLGHYIAKRLHLPLVHTEHGSGPVPHRPIIAAAAQLYDALIGRTTIRAADTVIALSHPGEKFVNSLGAHTTHVIPNGIDVEFFHPKFIRPAKRQALFIGRLTAGKGVADLITVWGEIIKDMTLIIIGDGPDRSQLERLAQPFSSIHFVGRQDRNGVRKLLATSQYLVNPSYAEGMPTCVLESLSMGVPVIATRVGGTSEIPALPGQLATYEAGNLEQLGQLLNQFIQHPAMRGKRTQQIEKKFSWEYITTKYAKLFTQTVHV